MTGRTLDTYHQSGTRHEVLSRVDGGLHLQVAHVLLRGDGMMKYVSCLSRGPHKKNRGQIPNSFMPLHASHAFDPTDKIR